MTEICVNNFDRSSSVIVGRVPQPFLPMEAEVRFESRWRATKLIRT
jgi:hypothetical protein